MEVPRSSQVQRAAVLVMGDVDRSPRMLNHAVCLATMTPCLVDMIGYRGSSLPEEIKTNQSIRVRYLSTKLIDKLRQLPRVFYLLYVLLRVLIQTFQILFMLMSTRYDFVLIQNPPCVPTFFACWIVKKLRCGRTRMIIDWHNYGYSILRVNGTNRFLLFVSKLYEAKFGRWLGDCHLCVSEAMKVDLTNQFRLHPVYVLKDAATARFLQMKSSKSQSSFMAMKDKHELFRRLGFDFEEQKQNGNELTRFTCYNWTQNKYSYREDRPVLLLSSTSYTPDEDFHVLIRALDLLDQRTKRKVNVIVTGKGPQKDFYMRIFEQRNAVWKQCTIQTAWLQIDDYPKLVASADLGVCLHFSSSGLDLPMKVVDMFAAGLPCLAYRYRCIGELVKENVNGRLFSSDKELADHLEEVIKGFDGENADGGTEELRKYREWLIKEFGREQWSDMWRQAFKQIMVVSDN